MKQSRRLPYFILSSILIASLVFAGISWPVQANNFESDEEVIISTASFDDDFADNRILVVLSNQASLKFKSYKSEDFSDIGCTTVRDLSLSAAQRVKDELSPGSAAATSVTTNARSTTSIDSFHQVICLELKEKGKDNVLAAIKKLQKREDIIYAGPDYVLSIGSTTPNDTYYNNQWASPKIDLPEAWDISTGSYTVTVGILDTGIDYSHPDLNGRINISASRDFTSGTPVPEVPNDQNGHGTHVAGIIGAKGNNSTGVSGVCWNVQMVSLQVMDSSGRGYASHIATAINYADNIGIPILNMSITISQGSIADDYALQSVIANYSGLVVCAAGNQGYNNDIYDHYPASYTLSNLITVGASNEYDQRCLYNDWSSNTGKKTVDIFAPGNDIYSTLPGNRYGYMDGTSTATPYVTGVAALLLSRNPNMSAAQIKSAIISGADPVSALSNLCVCGGRLNAYGALTD